VCKHHIILYNETVKTIGKIFFAVLLLYGVFYIALDEKEGETHVLRLSDRKIISFGQMIEDLKKTRLVFVGEIHNQEFHHRQQTAIIKALHDSGIRVAVGFEMFTAESQDDLNGWVNGRLPLGDFVKIYYKNWGMPWPLYRDILLYIQENRVPAVGLNIPPGISEKVAAHGFSSLTAGEIGKLPPGISCTVDDRYMEFIRRAYSTHRDSKEFVHFCEAQVLWDKTMAWNLVEFIRNNGAGTVVVLAGTGHAWKRGIPDQVRILSEKTDYKVILPEVPDYIEPNNITSEDADYILLER